MKSISILSNISNILKIKLVVFILFCLIGSFLILYYYKYINFFENTAVENTIVEGFNTSAPRIERTIVKEPVRFAYFYGGNDWFHLNSLLFFDDKGQLLRYGEDYKHYSTDGFGWWGAQDYRILFNNNPDQKNTYYHSASTNCTFVTVFTDPQSIEFPNKRDIFLSRIYICNRLAGPNSGNPFQPCSSGIHYRIKNYKLQLFSVVKQYHGWHNHEYNKNIFEYRLGDDGNLMRGSYDVILNFMPYVDPAIEAVARDAEAKQKSDAADKAAAAAKDAEAKLQAEIAAKEARRKAEEARRVAEELRQTSIKAELTKVSAYEDTAKRSLEKSDGYLQKLQKITDDTKFMTEPIVLDVETTNAIKSDSIIQISRYDMDSNVNTVDKIDNNLKNKENAIRINLENAVVLLQLIVVAYKNIISNKNSLSDINNKLAALNASTEQAAKFTASRANIITYIEKTNNNIGFANVSIDEVILSIRQIISSEKIVEQNSKIVKNMQKIKKNINYMTKKNEKANNKYKKSVDATSERKQNNPESILSNGIALGALV